jgi:hypothetical protein
MKTIIIVLLLCTAANAGERDQSRAFYDRNGSFSGSTIQHGNSTSAYDRAGRFDGTAIRNSDGTTSFYDRNGHFTGSAQPK